MGTPYGPGPLIYAHRGASAHAPDNSLEAFRLAVEAGTDGIELDVRRSADGKLILAHDPVHRTIGPLAEATLESIQAEDPAIVTLEQGMAAIPRSVFVNVEIKNHRLDPGFDRSRGIVDQVLEELAAYDDPERILISSFDPLSTRRAKRVMPDIPTGQLFAGRTMIAPAMRWATRHRFQAINIDRSLVAANPGDLVARATAQSLAVMVWTVDDPSEIERLFSAGVAAVITNDPAAGRTVVERSFSD